MSAKTAIVKYQRTWVQHFTASKPDPAIWFEWFAFCCEVARRG